MLTREARRTMRIKHECTLYDGQMGCPIDRYKYKSKIVEDCWVYQSQSTMPVPTVRVQNVCLPIARAVYIHIHGYTELDICHTCDNGRCWNPAHIYAGTTSQNMQDKTDRWDRIQGEKHPKRKYKDAEIHQMHELYSQGVRLVDIANIFNMNRGTAYSYVRGARSRMVTYNYGHD